MKYDMSKSRKYIVIGESHNHGNSSIDIECPFCKTKTTAYIWSLAGSGKKCIGCGSKHTWIHGTLPLFKKQEL